MSAAEKLASILPHITGMSSCVGCTAIIADISRHYRKHHQSTNHHKPSTYHRLMLGISATSISAAATSGLSTWPMPQGSAWQAFGSEGTCKAQAFFLQIGIGGPFYNLCLAIYYYLFIVKNFSSKRIARVEKFMHPLCLLFAFGTAILGLTLDVYGPASFWCWVEGEHVSLQWIFWHGPLWIIIVIVSVLMIVIYFKLRRQNHIQNRWNTASRRKTHAGSFFLMRRSTTRVRTDNIELSVNGDDNAENTRSSNKSMKTRIKLPSIPTRTTTTQSSSHEVFKWQSMYYLGAFYMTWIFLTVVRGMQAMNKEVPFWIALLAATLAPAGGLFNSLVYFRPKWIHYRKHHPEVARVGAFFTIVCPPLCHCKHWTLSLNQLICCSCNLSASEERSNRGIDSNEYYDEESGSSAEGEQ